eukprot:5008492-Pleurochrysis_carterae.AAC.1
MVSQQRHAVSQPRASSATPSQMDTAIALIQRMKHAFETRTVVATRRLVMTTLSPPTESPKLAPLAGETFRFSDAYPPRM